MQGVGLAIMTAHCGRPSKPFERFGLLIRANLLQSDLVHWNFFTLDCSHLAYHYARDRLSTLADLGPSKYSVRVMMSYRFVSCGSQVPC